MPALPPTASAEARQARDVMAFGQEVGRVLSDGRIVGRAEPFAKVFPSSRAVKRAVGLTAWAVLEDIALDARLDDRGRLTSETNVRQIAANLGVSKNTVTQHLARLRNHGFVFHEELRSQDSGRYEVSRYVLDPSACIERFTTTPRPRPHATEATSESAPISEKSPRPRLKDAVPPSPCPENGDTAPVSQSAGSRKLGQKNKKAVAAENQQQQRPELDDRSRTAVNALLAFGIDYATAHALAIDHPAGRIEAAVNAAIERAVRNPPGWVVAALRDGWELPGTGADQRATERRIRREAEAAAADADRRRRDDEDRARAERWAYALSGALDDDQLLAALTRVTTPAPGVNRRSVPLARAQLLAWAGAASNADPTRPLNEALVTALDAESASPSHIDGQLPEPPPHVPPAPPLSDRIAALLPRLPSTTSARSRKES